MHKLLVLLNEERDDSHLAIVCHQRVREMSRIITPTLRKILRICIA